VSRPAGSAGVPIVVGDVCRERVPAVLLVGVRMALSADVLPDVQNMPFDASTANRGSFCTICTHSLTSSGHSASSVSFRTSPAVGSGPPVVAIAPASYRLLP
jgi:hypothetical protein